MRYFSYPCLHLYVCVLGSLLPQKKNVFHQFQTNNRQWRVLGIDLGIGYMAGVINHTDQIATCYRHLIKR